MFYNIDCGDTLILAKEKMKPETVDLLVTSPPYWAKRVYNGEGEIGSEPTPQEYVSRLADFFDSLKWVLKPTANVFINIGDTYFGSGAGAWKKLFNDDGAKSDVKVKEKYRVEKPLQPKIKQDGKLFQNKQLLLIPSRFAIEMQERGWLLREDIIWRKPNRIPSGVSDRCINVYEHVFHFVLNRKYFFNLDAIKIPAASGGMKNPGDVWDINTQPLKGTHTASFPEELVERIILCGCPEGGTVFDPFLGTGTTAVVAYRLNRDCYGYEINREFFEQANDRMTDAILANIDFH